MNGRIKRGIMKTKLLFIFLTFILSRPLQATSKIDKILGANDIIAVDEAASNIPQQYRHLIDAIGRTNEGCTVTHIGYGIVLSAGHCFWAPATEPVENRNCNEVTISWGLRGQKAPYLISKCDTVVLAQKNQTIDFAILKVSPVPFAFINVDLQRKAIVGDQLTMFSHPDGLPLQWSNYCQMEDSTDPTVPDKALKHQCDSDYGSSGAAILSAFSLKIVAIHNGGYVNNYGQGMNFGTFITDTPLSEKLKSLGF